MYACVYIYIYIYVIIYVRLAECQLAGYHESQRSFGAALSSMAGGADGSGH